MVITCVYFLTERKGQQIKTRGEAADFIQRECTRAEITTVASSVRAATTDAGKATHLRVLGLWIIFTKTEVRRME